jgi:type IV pilus assembly protein PilP
MTFDRLKWLLMLVFVLGACSPGSDLQRLQQQLADIAARPGGAVEPLPSFEPYEAFTYSAASLRSPFDPPQLVSADRDEVPELVQPDFDRVSEPLEAFALNTLEMVGMLTRGSIIIGLVRDEDGYIHRVSRGNYLGRNHGRITNVSAEQIELTEIVPSGDGGWVERPRSLVLSN